VLYRAKNAPEIEARFIVEKGELSRTRETLEMEEGQINGKQYGNERIKT